MIFNRYARRRTLALAAVLAGQCLAVQAETTATFQVSATIERGCVVMGATNVTSGDVGSWGTLDFGTASALSQATLTANTVMTSGITLRCTPDMQLKMRIDGGLHASDGLRHVAGADGSQLAYNLHTGPNNNNYVKPDAESIITVSGGDLVSLPIYGVLDLPGNAHGGGYTDTLQVTLSW